MPETKPWYLSRGVWGGLIALAIAAASAFGYSVAETDVEQLQSLATSLVAAASGILSILGRIRASKKLTL